MPDFFKTVPSPQDVDSLSSARRIVIKLGTQIVVDPSGRLSHERLRILVEQCIALHQAGKEIILVSSGAVGLGKNQLGLSGSLTLPEKQACAAVGQSLLMDAYRHLFLTGGLQIAQVLLTALDFADRKHYLNLQHSLETLLKLGVIPIINENDVTSTMELQEEGYTKGFGDNDKLSALVAGKLDADLLVILTNVAGIYTDNPDSNPDAEKISVVQTLQDLQRIGTAGRSAMGRGGMASKLEAARIAAISGLPTYITSGLTANALSSILQPNGELDGTLVLPQTSLSGRKRWIGTASGYHGVVTINDGAANALLKKGASLLPVGVVRVDGDFTSQQVVSVQDSQQHEIGRGVCAFSSAELRKIKGSQGERLNELLGSSSREEVIHRDNLVIFSDAGFE